MKAVIKLYAALFILALPFVYLNAEEIPRLKLQENQANCQQLLDTFLNRKLEKGEPKDWVDANRWACAQARLLSATQLEEANDYFEHITWRSMENGLIEDSDIQITDLLRTYLTFEGKSTLSEAAKKHLLDLFKNWQVPNQDRNRNADKYYEWPGEYTENHSFNILTASYLIDSILKRDRSLRKSLLERFLYDRSRWGWSEFHAPGYGLISTKALALLVDFAPDPSVATFAKMHLDLIFYEFACQSLGTGWRGVPFARGYGMQRNNAANTLSELWHFLFQKKETGKIAAGNPFLVHFCSTSYRPPVLCQAITKDKPKLGRYLFRQTATHGPAKLRIPFKLLVTPHVSMSSVQGYSCFYDPCYWSISFASSPNRVITSVTRQTSNAYQLDNVLLVFGEARFFGNFSKFSEGNITIYDDGTAFAGHLLLAEKCHVFLVGEKQNLTQAQIVKSMKSLNVTMKDGIVTWQMPDGRQIKVQNEPYQNGWRCQRVYVNEQLQLLDNNMLYDCPYMRSERGSAVTAIQCGDQAYIYDFSDMTKPVIKSTKSGPFPKLPPDEVVAPTGIVFRRIPAGEFCQGSAPCEGRKNETPQRWIYLDEFYMSATEVTIKQYEQYAKSNPDSVKIADWLKSVENYSPDYPIVYVSWHDAMAFCQWLTKQDPEYRYSLPSEAQWEKAAKGYSHRLYPWGESYDGTQAGSRNTVYLPVKSKPEDVSPFGVYDMAGNVWEWCLDNYEPGSYSAQLYRNPVNKQSPGTLNVLRGCGWNFDPDTFRCAYRSRALPSLKSRHIGFRIIRIKK